MTCPPENLGVPSFLLDGQGLETTANLTRSPEGDEKEGGGAPNSFILPIVSKPVCFLVYFQPIDVT